MPLFCSLRVTELLPNLFVARFTLIRASRESLITSFVKEITMRGMILWTKILFFSFLLPLSFFFDAVKMQDAREYLLYRT